MNKNHAHARKNLIGPFSLGILVTLALATMIAMATGSPAGAQTGGAGAGGAASAGSGDRYDRLWNSFSRKNRRWAKRTSRCESGGDASLHGSGGTYHGAFQFSLGTWGTAPRSPGGDPHSYRWRVQAVVAIALKRRDGAAGHWPVCG